VTIGVRDGSREQWMRAETNYNDGTTTSIWQRRLRR